MKSQKVGLLEEIEFDIREAKEFFDSWKIGGGDEFHQRFRDTISWIEWNPELFAKRYRFFRKAVVKNTYYGIFYAIEPDVTTVVAVVDLRQNPSRIRRLLRIRKPSIKNRPNKT